MLLSKQAPSIDRLSRTDIGIATHGEIQPQADCAVCYYQGQQYSLGTTVCMAGNAYLQMCRDVGRGPVWTGTGVPSCPH
jgi:hypothetical protein